MSKFELCTLDVWLEAPASHREQALHGVVGERISVARQS